MSLGLAIALVVGLSPLLALSCGVWVTSRMSPGYAVRWGAVGIATIVIGTAVITLMHFAVDTALLNLQLAVYDTCQRLWQPWFKYVCVVLDSVWSWRSFAKAGLAFLICAGIGVMLALRMPAWIRKRVQAT